MMTWILASVAGAATSFVANSLMAAALIGPLFSEQLGVVRSREQGLQWAAMLGGTLLLAGLCAYLYPRLDFGLPNEALRGALLGALIGLAVFGAGHLIVAGWSTIPAAPMFWSGLLDALAWIPGGVAIALAYRWLGGLDVVA
ncbi:MAG: hypothetical protein K1X75_07560 [Leptospirales bacterium]|nr:hypothetical protein [Leptospirales bacterium]